MVYRKRKAPIISDDNILISPKKRRIIKKQKISNSNIKKDCMMIQTQKIRENGNASILMLLMKYQAAIERKD